MGKEILLDKSRLREVPYEFIKNFFMICHWNKPDKKYPGDLTRRSISIRYPSWQQK